MTNKHTGKVIISKDTRGQGVGTVKAPNGKTVGGVRGHNTNSGTKKGIQALKTALKNPKVIVKVAPKTAKKK